jgi:hypothetical protein
VKLITGGAFRSDAGEDADIEGCFEVAAGGDGGNGLVQGKVVLSGEGLS